MGKTALYVSSLLMVWLIPFPIFAQQGVSGTQTQGQIGPEKEKACAPIGPFKEGEACYLEKVPCLDGKEGLIISRCNNKGQCVGVESCGKPLEKPTEIPDAPAPQQPSPAPDPVPETGGPAIDDIFPGGGNVGNGGGSSLEPLPDDTLPAIEVVSPINPSPVKPGSTFTSPAGDPFTLGPSRPGGASGSSGGVFSGGNPFEFTADTFGTVSGGGWGTPSDTAGFSSFFSNIVNLFSGFGGGQSLPATSPFVTTFSRPVYSPNTGISRLAPQQVADSGQSAVLPNNLPSDLEEYIQRFQNPLERLLDPLPRDAAGFPEVPDQSDNRSGLSNGNDLIPRESIMGPRPDPTTESGNPIRFPGNILKEFESPPEPLPVGGVDVADAEPGIVDAPPLPNAPDWWTDEMVSRFAQELEGGMRSQDATETARSFAVDQAYECLSRGTCTTGDSVVGAARRVLEEDLQRARFIRDREYLTHSIGLTEWFDKYIYPTSQVARDEINAEARLNDFGRREATAQLRAQAGEIGPPPPEPELVGCLAFVCIYTEKATPTLTNPAAEGALKAYERAQSAIADRFLKFQTGFQDTVRDYVNRVDRFAFGENFSGELPEVSPAESPEAPAPPAPPPAVSADSQPPPTSQPPQGAPPSRPSTATPGNTAPPPSQVAQQSSGFSQGFVSGGFNLLGALLSTLGSLFSSEEESSNAGTVSPVPITTPREEQPRATLVANPSSIPKGKTTILSWASVGTRGCAVIDRSFKEFARSGSSGNVVSPTLERATRFGIVCDIKNGTDKFVAEVLVRVEGDDSTPPPIFSTSGRVSEARSNSSANINGANSTSNVVSVPHNSPQPSTIKVEVCDPDQDFQEYLQCLCEVEPNPNGCSFL